MEPFHMDNGKDDDHEPEEIFDLLPARFREISGSSTAMEGFNLMNDDLISHRIIPALHRRLRIAIANARSGLIVNRLRHLVDSAPPSPRNCSLLFRVIPKLNYRNMSEMKFIDCAIRDKRMSPFPHREFTALTHQMPTEFSSRNPIVLSFVEAIGHKIIFWNQFKRRHPLCYILNAEHNSDRAFRALDTPTILQQLPWERLNWIKKAIVGNRLIVFLATTIGAFMLSLDVNTERWSLLPECPATWFNEYHTPIPWKGKLYFVDINSWLFRRTDDATQVVPMHFDLHRNMWVIGGDENTTFAQRFMSFYPRYGFPTHQNLKLVIVDRGRCMISSKSGTLYAISHAPENVYSYDDQPIGNIYAMDDLTRGWKQIECRKSEHTQQIDPFKLPKISDKLLQGVHLLHRFNCWEINEHDILLVALQYSNLAHGLSARYAWWIFNQDDGVKNYGCEEFSKSELKNASYITLLKLEM